jgi:4-amino-4-deoxy-L-arabinose transferase-like glycosyltransferase
MVLATLLVIVGSYLVRLSSPEIQPWDEALYAVRGASAVVFSSWSDQTPHAIGGLYSSTAPPFVTWLVGAAISAIGPSDTAVRLPIVLCSLAALFLVYRLARRMVSHDAALLAVAILGTAQPWVIFSRSAMTEVPLIMWCLLALEASILFRERKGALVPAAVFAAAFGGALLTKMTVSYLPLLFVVPLLTERLSRPKELLPVVLAVLGGLAIAAPWYASMVSTHGDAFTMAMTAPHIRTAVEGNVGNHGVFYYVNRLVAAQPFLVAALLYCGAVVAVPRLRPSRMDVLPWLLVVWFVVGLIILSVSATKNLHYTLFLLAPASMIAVWAFDRLRSHSHRLLVVGYAMVLGASAWVALPAVRASLSQGSPSALAIAVLVAMAAVVIASVLVPKQMLGTVAALGWKPVVGVALIASAYTALSTILFGRPEHVLGGRQIASKLIDIDVRNFGFLYHASNDGDALAPQLAWYMGGRMTGWMPGYGYEAIAMPRSEASDVVVGMAYGRRFAYVVYHTVGASAQAIAHVQASLGIGYDVILETSHYVLFRRRG